MMILSEERNALVMFGKKMLNAGLTTGSGGNLSCLNREMELVAITPSGIEYPNMTALDTVVLDLKGNCRDGRGRPSSETGFHLALYEKRKDVNAIVHTHSPYATTFACLNREIPAVHYLVGFAGNKVPVAPYATFGTDKLANNIIEVVGNYNAVLLANHGLVALGDSLSRAFNTAEEIELVARICYQAESIGAPVILPDDEMERVIEKFKNYGAGSVKDAS